jgi:hypothetical protein
MAQNDAWPALPLAEWRQTCDTLHMLTQIVGKIRLGLAPEEPEWAHVALYVSPLGLTTGPIPFEGRSFQIDFDFHAHQIDIVASDGQAGAIPLVAASVADYYKKMLAVLHAMGIRPQIWPMPVEVKDAIRFDQDTTHASYDPEYASRFARILVQVDTALKEHRAPFRRRHSLVQFFFGSFDIAYGRYSGRPAKPPSDDIIMREAMDAEEICAGFWPGDDRFPEPAFWCYAYPKPAGLENEKIAPSAASWNNEMGEFILRYEDVRTADAPREALREFFTSTYEACAKLAKWDQAPGALP